MQQFEPPNNEKGLVIPARFSLFRQHLPTQDAEEP